MHSSDLERLGLRELSSIEPVRAESAFVVSCLRNERHRLPDFLSHYRQLGAGPFLMVDNGSTDGSIDYLLEQPDVVLYHTEASYSQSRCGLDWTTALANQYIESQWTLTVDVDEHFVFPNSEQLRLDRFLAHLDRCSCNALLCFLLDMYSDKPIRETRAVEGVPLVQTCPYYDATGYWSPWWGKLARVPHRGGPRQRLFWEGRGLDYPSPYLPKIPLLRWPGGNPYTASTHKIDGARFEGSTGVLLHFKFLEDFPATAAAEARRGEHFAGARQYKAYAQRFQAEPDLCAHYEGSFRYQGTRALMALGLLRADRSLRRMWCDEEDSTNQPRAPQAGAR